MLGTDCSDGLEASWLVDPDLSDGLVVVVGAVTGSSKDLRPL